MAQTFNSLGAFAGFLARRTVAFRSLEHLGVALGAHAVEKNAKRAMGDVEKLVELTPWTQAERVAKGFSQNDPLVRSGELRDSIETDVAAIEAEASVGSADPRFPLHELGGVNDLGHAIPARPVLQIGIIESKAEIEGDIMLVVEATFGGVKPRATP